jgi:hypothetical protein
MGRAGEGSAGRGVRVALMHLPSSAPSAPPPCIPAKNGNWQAWPVTVVLRRGGQGRQGGVAPEPPSAARAGLRAPTRPFSPRPPSLRPRHALRKATVAAAAPARVQPAAHAVPRQRAWQRDGGAGDVITCLMRLARNMPGQAQVSSRPAQPPLLMPTTPFQEKGSAQGTPVAVKRAVTLSPGAGCGQSVEKSGEHSAQLPSSSCASEQREREGTEVRRSRMPAAPTCTRVLPPARNALGRPAPAPAAHLARLNAAEPHAIAPQRASKGEGQRARRATAKAGRSVAVGREQRRAAHGRALQQRSGGRGAAEAAGRGRVPGSCTLAAEGPAGVGAAAAAA